MANKKIIVASDSHGNTELLKHLALIHSDASLFLHLGDSQDSETNIYPFITIKGNNDFLISRLDRVVTFGTLKIYMTHGHKMYLSKENMIAKAKKYECNMFLFGHTNRPFYEVCEGVHILNPGALSYPRSAIGATYAIVNILENGSIDVSFDTI